MLPAPNQSTFLPRPEAKHHQFSQKQIPQPHSNGARIVSERVFPSNNADFFPKGPGGPVPNPQPPNRQNGHPPNGTRVFEKPADIPPISNKRLVTSVDALDQAPSLSNSFSSQPASLQPTSDFFGYFNQRLDQARDDFNRINVWPIPDAFGSKATNNSNSQQEPLNSFSQTNQSEGKQQSLPNDGRVAASLPSQTNLLQFKFVTPKKEDKKSQNVAKRPSLKSFSSRNSMPGGSKRVSFQEVPDIREVECWKDFNLEATRELRTKLSGRSDTGLCAIF